MYEAYVLNVRTTQNDVWLKKRKLLLVGNNNDNVLSTISYINIA